MRAVMLSLGVPAVLAGCVAAGPVRPLAVEVAATGIEARMSDGGICRGAAPAAGGSWSGQLQDCATPYPYDVVFEARRNPLRTGLEDVFGALGLDLAPVAQVAIHGPRGNTWRFASPPRRTGED